jgi:hypothetical protein
MSSAITVYDENSGTEDVGVKEAVGVGDGVCDGVGVGEVADVAFIILKKKQKERTLLPEFMFSFQHNYKPR